MRFSPPSFNEANIHHGEGGRKGGRGQPGRVPQRTAARPNAERPAAVCSAAGDARRAVCSAVSVA
eukprot:453018-Rhodomonas_salina.1